MSIKTLIEKFKKLGIAEEEIELKNRVTKDKDKLDKWSDDKDLDRFEDDEEEQIVYIDPKEKEIKGVYDKKKGKFFTNISKEDVEKEIGESNRGYKER